MLEASWDGLNDWIQDLLFTLVWTHVWCGPKSDIAGHTRSGPFPAPKTKTPKQMLLKRGLQCVYAIKFLQSTLQDSLNLGSFNNLPWGSPQTAPLPKSVPRAGFSPDLCISDLLFNAEPRGTPS